MRSDITLPLHHVGVGYGTRRSLNSSIESPTFDSLKAGMHCYIIPDHYLCEIPRKNRHHRDYSVNLTVQNASFAPHLASLSYRYLPTPVISSDFIHALAQYRYGGVPKNWNCLGIDFKLIFFTRSTKSQCQKWRPCWENAKISKLHRKTSQGLSRTSPNSSRARRTSSLELDRNH